MNPSPPPIAIVGAGYLGTAVARALDAPVLAVNRSGEWRGGPRPAGLHMLALNLMAPTLDPSALRASRAALLCYAPGREQSRHELYVQSTRRLLDRWGAGSLRRLVWVGSTSALPDRDAWLDESCTDWPEAERGRVQRQAEQVVIEHATRHGIPWLVLRMGGLYGPGRSLARIYQRGGDRARATPTLPGHGMAPTNLIHLSDAVQAAVAALATAPQIQGIVHVVADDHRPRRELYAEVARHEDRPPISWAEPIPPDGVARGKRVENQRLGTWLGVRLRVPRHRWVEDEG